jgi:fructose-1,6-bisphosphatase/inositol monophosphatase family enzyme
VPLSAAEEAGLVALVRRAARDEILPRFRRLPVADVRAKTAPDDLVTEADLAAEFLIAAGVARLMPGAETVGEEAVTSDPAVLDRIATAERAVIVDPVDGTWNFAHGLATFGTILAVTLRGETVFGLLYDPVMDDWVLARKGGGAWYVRPGEAPRRLRLGPPDPAPGDVTGLVPLFLFPPETRARLAVATAGMRRVWSLRCSCHEYRLMAQGGADFCLTATVNPWDHAAGVLAVTEAGGAAGLLGGGDWAPVARTGQILVARSAGLLADLRTRLAPLV